MGLLKNKNTLVAAFACALIPAVISGTAQAQAPTPAQLQYFPIIDPLAPQIKPGPSNVSPFFWCNYPNEYKDDSLNQINPYYEAHIDQFKALIGEWSRPDCLTLSGNPKLSYLSKFFHVYFASGNWTERQLYLENLKKNNPNEPFVALAEAYFWNVYAWDARGTGYASTVSEDGWKLFNERMERSDKILEDSKPYASSLPNWYSLRIGTQSLLDRPASERDQTFVEGAHKFKLYYPIYITMAKYLSPKWGGDWDQVDNMVKWAVENTKDQIGTSIYARIYWSQFLEMPEPRLIFKETRATWPKMKKSFEDMMAKWPNSVENVNAFAMFACVAGDKKTYASLRNEFSGILVVNEIWSSMPIDLCDAKYFHSG